MQAKQKEPKYPRWLKIENKANEHKQGITILCRNEIEYLETKQRYSGVNYIVSEFNSDPRKNILKQRKSYS